MAGLRLHPLHERMLMKRVCLGLTFLLVVGNAPVMMLAGSCPTDRPHALYSAVAMNINDNRYHLLFSPDGQKSVRAAIKTVLSDPNGMQVQLTVKVGKAAFKAHLSGWGSEIAWSSDSKAFFVTQTEGGGGFGIATYVFYVSDAGLRKVDISRTVERKHGRPAQCGGDIDVNVAGIAWLEASQRLLVVAEAPPIAPICKCPGAFTAYEIELPENRIAKSYSQRQTKQLYGKLLGCELLAAKDNCRK